MTATPVDALKLLTVFVPLVQQLSSQLELFRNDKQQREVCIVDGRRKQINSERINLATISARSSASEVEPGLSGNARTPPATTGSALLIAAALVALAENSRPPLPSLPVARRHPASGRTG